MSKRDILTYARGLVRAGVMERPLWMTAVERTPPLPLAKAGRKPPRLAFPEDELIEAYYRRHPEARLEPLDLSSFEPPAGRRFALRQLALVQDQGMTKSAAAAVVEAEFARQRAAGGGGGHGARASIIDQIQAEEEAALQGALRHYAKRAGPQAVKQHARELWQMQTGRPPARPAGLSPTPAAQARRQQRQAATGNGGKAKP